MQRDKAAPSMALTPRFELGEGSHVYTDIHDGNPTVSHAEEQGGIVFHVRASLVNNEQRGPASGSVVSDIQYRFEDSLFTIQASTNGTEPVPYVLPIIVASTDRVERVSDRILELTKNGARLRLESDTPFDGWGSGSERIFNFVPGLQALPLRFTGQQITIKIAIT